MEAPAPTLVLRPAHGFGVPVSFKKPNVDWIGCMFQECSQKFVPARAGGGYDGMRT